MDFKRFLAGLRSLVGGPVRSYESLLDRARREAILRMQKVARDSGFDAVVNVRLETARLASTWRRNQRTAGVEVLAFGTGLKLAGSGVSGAAAVAVATPWIGVGAAGAGLVGLLLFEHAYVQAGQSVPLA